MQTYRPTLGVLCQKEMSSAKSGVCEHPLFLTVLASNEGCFLYLGKKKKAITQLKQMQNRNNTGECRRRIRMLESFFQEKGIFQLLSEELYSLSNGHLTMQL